VRCEDNVGAGGVVSNSSYTFFEMHFCECPTLIKIVFLNQSKYKPIKRGANLKGHQRVAEGTWVFSKVPKRMR